MTDDVKSDQEMEKLREELAQIESMDTSGSTTGYGGYPTPPSKDSIFKFFREILQSKDSRKTGNLKEAELGQARLGVRHYLQVAQFAESEGLSDVSDYLKKEAEIVLSTSLSRKGFLPQIFVTQIKKEQKLKEPVPQKKGLFGGGQKNED